VAAPRNARPPRFAPPIGRTAGSRVNYFAAFRASGTEPLIRCYIEAKSKSNLKELDAACRQLLAA